LWASPGETPDDVEALRQFPPPTRRLDAIGRLSAYSSEDGTEAAGLPGELSEDEVADRVSDLADLRGPS